MRKKRTFLLSVLALLFLSPLAVRAQVVYPNQDTVAAGAGFSGSPHDFYGAAANNPLGDNATTGGCTYCHTPHKAYQTRLLWNHTLSNNTFSWSDATQTIGGTPFPTINKSWSGPTKFCLSCHDGSVAIGDIAWFNEASWNSVGRGLTVNPSVNGPIDTGKHLGDEFQIATAGGDLAGNHPVAFPYPFNQAANTYNGTTTGGAVYTPQFNADPTTLGIRLFNDSGATVTAGAVAGKTGMECTSCHGVHNEPGLVFDKPLLRGTKTGDSTGSGASYICMKCHTK